MRKSSIALIICGFSVILNGCGTAWFAPPDQYATAPGSWAANPHVRHNDYDPVISDNDRVREKFLRVLLSDCQKAIIDADRRARSGSLDQDTAAFGSASRTYKISTSRQLRTPTKTLTGETIPSNINSDCPNTPQTDPTSYACWVRQHRAASMCADAIALHAINQCVAKSGGQNAFSAQANIVLGTVLSAGSLAADAAALSSKGSNATVAVAASSAINSGANNVKTFAPSTVTIKVSDFVSAEQSYVALAHFTDSELLQLYPLLSYEKDAVTQAENGRVYLNSNSPAQQVALRYSRFHDAVFAVCPVGAY